MGDQPMKSILAAMQEAYGIGDIQEHMTDLMTDLMNEGLLDAQDLEIILGMAERHHSQ